MYIHKILYNHTERRKMKGSDTSIATKEYVKAPSVCVYVCVCMRACICVYMCVYVCVRACMCMCIFEHISRV